MKDSSLNIIHIFFLNITQVLLFLLLLTGDQSFCVDDDGGGSYKGQMASPKRMNFRKSSKRPLTPPSFSEHHIADFATKVRDFATKVRMFILAGLLYII